MQPIVIDLSHHNWDNHHGLDFAKAKAAGVKGVIYKASEGASFRDPFYAKTRDAVKAAGLLWGAYHFATAADAEAQVANFLAAADPDAQMLVALDFEHNDPAPANTTSPVIARQILGALRDKLGRPAVLYTGAFMFDCFGGHPQADLGAHRLWWARYASTPRIHPSWHAYWLWQYSDGVHGPGQKTVDGIGACDCDFFEGTAETLAAQWA